MMKETESGVLLEIRIKTNAKKFGFLQKNGKIFLEVTSPPRKSKANTEIVKQLKKTLGNDVKIVKGLKSKDKIIFIVGAKIEDIKKLILGR